VKVTALPFFQHVKWSPDAKELRRFAVAMVIGFGLLGFLSVWRANGISNLPIVLWGLGLFLAISALIPGLGRPAYLAVYLPSSIIGYFVSQILLALIFFFVITPLAIILRLTGKDILQQRRRDGWMRVRNTKTDDSYYRQF